MTRKILCPVDFSKGSEHAVRKAAELARMLQAELELLHAYQLPILALPDAPVTVSPGFVADLTDRAQRALEQLRSKLQQDGQVITTRLVQGNPADEIVQRAKDIGAELIVLGTHGHGGFRRFLLGSTTERVVRTATVPVLTVHLPE